MPKNGTYFIYNVNYGYKMLQCTNQPIPIKPEHIKEYLKIPVNSGLDEIYQLSLAEKEVDNHSLAMPLHLAIANDISMINGEIISANRNLSLYAYANILDKIKTKLLNIFNELEKQYGNLDDYYIDFKNTKKEKEVNKIIVNIIYTDNSVSIGDKNKIENSTVGVGNES